MAEAKTEEKQDFWQKIAGMSKEELVNVEVLISRVLPTEDAKTGYPIDGHCKTVKAGNLTLESVNEIVGGGTYRLQARTADKKTFVCQTTVRYPGIPKIVLPGSDPDQGKAKSPDPARSDNSGPGRGSFEAGVRAGAEQARREFEIKEIRAAVARLERGPATGAQLDSNLMSLLVNAIIKTSAGGNGQPLSVADVLTFIDKAREDGKEVAREIAQAIESYAPGADGDAVVKGKLVDVLGKFADNAIKQKRFDKAAEKVKSSAKPAAQMLVAIRDNVADMIEKEFGAPAKTAAQALRGSRTLQEFLSAIQEVITQLGEELRGEGADEEETDEPGGGEKATEQE